MKAFQTQLTKSKNFLRRQQFSTATPALTNKEFIERDQKYVAHNYGPLPIAITKAKGLYMWDVEGRRYMDFLCGYSALNQGHLHPKIVKAMVDQSKNVTMTSRAFYNDQLGPFAEYLTKLLGYDKFLPMNSGVEACETAVKLARRWGYQAKGIPKNKATVLMAEGCFWGRSITASGACDDPQRYKDFGPFTPGFELVPFNDLQAIKMKFDKDPNICAIMLEPIQGENGVIVPNDGYLKAVSQLCKEYNVLLITDEVQTGFGRTGKLMCHHWDNIKPDMITMGKAMSGGMLPVSGVVADNKVMDLIHAGDHGSTYGGNPLAMAVAKAAIQTLIEEGMVDNSEKMGVIMKDKLSSIKSKLIKDVRGRGLFVAIETHHDLKVDANDLAYVLLKKGLATKATHDHTIRLAPALIIKESEVKKACKLVKESIRELEALNSERSKQ